MMLRRFNIDAPSSSQYQEESDGEWVEWADLADFHERLRTRIQVFRLAQEGKIGVDADLAGSCIDDLDEMLRRP